MPDITFNRTTTLKFPGSQIADITNGIVNGSLAIREILCSDRLAFGDINSNQFQCQLYDCPNLTGKKIQVVQNDNGTNKTLFTGWVDSCKTDDLSGFKTIVAYDYFYKARKKKIKGWWNSFWENQTQSTLGTMWRSLLSYYNISYINTTLICDNLVIKKTKKLKKLKTSYLSTFLTQLCEINLCIPNMNREGTLEFKQFTDYALLSANAIDIRGDYTISKSKFEDYVVAPYDKVELYDVNNNLQGSSGSGDNILSIQNNLFLYNQTNDVMNTLAELMLSNMFEISYIPANIVMKVSNLNLHLGDLLQTQKGLCLICENDLTGALLVDQSIVSNNATERGSTGNSTALGTNTERNMDRVDFVADTKAEIGVDTYDPNVEGLGGQEGDMYVQETSKTIKTNITKPYGCWKTYHAAQTNLIWYAYDTVTVTCNAGNFVCCCGKSSNAGRTWVVAGSKSRTIEDVLLVCRVPYGSPAPMFTSIVSDVQKFNAPPPYPFHDVDPDPCTMGYNTSNVIHSNNRTYDYYYASLTTYGTWVSGIRHEIQEPDYEFESRDVMLAAIADDLIDIPDIYEGADTSQLYYNNGSGSSESWKKVPTVTGVAETEDAGGTENNGMTIDQTTQQISLKKNVVRAWYKPDPPQADKTFSQLCVRYTGIPDKQVIISHYADHTWQNDSITKDDDKVYKIKCKGTTNTSQINYVVYAISGLTIGKKYYLNFRCDYSNNASFDFDMSKGCGLVFNTSGVLTTGNYSGDEDKFYPETGYYAFRRRTESWYADFELTADASIMYMCVLMQAETNANNVSFTLSEFVISQKERQLIRNIYLYDYTAKEWLKYKPFSGSTSGGDEGGSVISIQPTLSSGTKIANFSIDGEPGELYAPDGGASDYDDLSNKPSVNGVTLSGNKTSSDLGIVITLTQAQYDALTTEQKNDPNKVYYISDASGGGGTSPLFIDSSGYISIDYDLVRRES